MQRAYPAERHVLVIGAGIGGLAAALRLASRGVKVTVVERAAAPGGKLRQVGPGIDAGPTVFTMRWVFDELFDAAGLRFEDRVGLTPLGVLARHAWRSGARLDLHADRACSAAAIEAFAGADEAGRFLGFCAQAERVLRALEGPYIRAGRPSVASLGAGLGPRGLGALASLGPLRSLWSSLARHFRDPRLQQLFGRYATYCGSSPFEAPATLMLIAQVEMDGVWSVAGGMHALALATMRAAEERGARFVFGHEATQLVVRDGRAVGVRVAPVGEGARARTIDADAVVFNGDTAALAAGRLGAEAARAVPAAARARSLSALTWCLQARTAGFPLARHTVFFDDDYASEFDDVFHRGRLPRRGTVYVCAQDRLGDEAPEGPERLLMLVNAPALGDRGAPTEMEIDACEKDRLAFLSDCGLRIEPSISTTRTGPIQFEALFPATGGALYGRPSHGSINGWMSPFRRPGATSRLPGLMLAGGSVHPGAGVPMAALSGRWAAEATMAHLASMRRSRPAATSGGTSTHSATTAVTD
ncbi:MAG TPA: phytoene desaturase family protein [Methylibium sp.]|uniref:1-hydroxycarotenoid 3,4-desaturase CrtD n=1 Tax=Methylibium sp. TaxID=2067992 RepID=UPI002DBA6C1A|nr:1-hydroxycarotenoid 3,4-desaturase CrtD [Methylibium sp.]HEU4457684.1 phytoene desaturase family protein [Methylibium sp.]